MNRKGQKRKPPPPGQRDKPQKINPTIYRCRKKKFKHKEWAEDALTRAIKDGRTERGVYECPDCGPGTWHLTSQSHPSSSSDGEGGSTTSVLAEGLSSRSAGELARRLGTPGGENDSWKETSRVES